MNYENDCDICYETKDIRYFRNYRCGHKACIDCVNSILMSENVKCHICRYDLNYLISRESPNIILINLDENTSRNIFISENRSSSVFTYELIVRLTFIIFLVSLMLIISLISFLIPMF